jgi:predicted RNase H-like HicB family nuclease
MKLTIRILQNEDGGYTAVCPTLPGCVSQGPTRQQATDRLDEAIRGYIAAVSNFVPEKVDHEVTEVH